MDNQFASIRAFLVAMTVAAGAVLCAQADIVSNCFKVVNYSANWHVECTLDGFANALDIAIDDNAHNGFRAGDHGSSAYAYFAAAESGETIDAGSFIRMSGMVEFVDQGDFIVAFVIGCTESNRIDGNFGWVRLAYEGGTMVLKGGAINTTRGFPLVAEGGQPPSILNPETGCETNTFYATSERMPHILHRRDAALDFVIFSYTESCWGVAVQHSSGRGYVAMVPAGTYVDDSTFAQQRTSDGYDSGDLFFLAFKWWPDANDTTRRTRYGWLAIGLKDGAPAVLASEMSETAGAPLVARGFSGVDDGPDEPVEGLIWRCNFNGGVQRMSITDLVEVVSHVALVGNGIEAIIDNGSYSGRRCAGIEGVSGERAWFFVNAKDKDGRGERYMPGKWQSLKTSFKLKSKAGCMLSDEMYETMPATGGNGNRPHIGIVMASGTVVNIDDKIALRYCELELDDDSEFFWQVNAVVANGLGGIEAQTLRLAANERWNELASPIGNWITVEIEAVNDGSPLGLAYRIYIDGVLACSEEDGSTVFRARPQAAEREGVSALGIGGLAYIDDVVFSDVATDPLAGIDIQPSRFGSAQIELTNDELVNLVGIMGFEAISGLERVFLEPWVYGNEPEDAPKTCIELGISPFLVESDDQNGLMLYFKNPTVVATGIDPVTRTVTGMIVPAEGTRVVQPPMTYMFGISHFMDFGTPYAHAEEYGYEMCWNQDQFQLDISNYAASNGLFKITYDPKFSEEGSAFFSLSVRDFRYWP